MPPTTPTCRSTAASGSARRTPIHLGAGEPGQVGGARPRRRQAKRVLTVAGAHCDLHPAKARWRAGRTVRDRYRRSQLARRRNAAGPQAAIDGDQRQRPDVELLFVALTLPAAVGRRGCGMRNLFSFSPQFPPARRLRRDRRQDRGRCRHFAGEGGVGRRRRGDDQPGEADQKRGRELRKEEEERGRQVRLAEERCRKAKPLPTDNCAAVQRH